MSFDTPQMYRWKDPTTPPGAPALTVYFVQEPHVNAAATKATGIQTYDNVLVAYVSAKPQDKSNVAHEIRRTLPDGTVKENRATVFKYAEPLKHYDAGTAAESLGTPLKDLIGMTPATIMNLRARGISTIEALHDLPDSAGHELMGFWEFRDRARKFMAHRKEQAPMVKLDAMEIAHAKTVEALELKIADLVSRLPAPDPEQTMDATPRRGPGRPPKIQEAA